MTRFATQVATIATIATMVSFTSHARVRVCAHEAQQVAASQSSQSSQPAYGTARGRVLPGGRALRGAQSPTFWRVK